MRKNSEKRVEESGAAFALAVVLLNMLTFAAAGALVWALQMIITLHSPFSEALREAAWR
ncbi:MAG TPA: hypothetical protein VK400_11485 [Pyrinomonadaceae bacterium]|nr:hypothetical protein [Pyrinomonadaceae bacterium]